jgi:ABC-type uncharacterized transport system ATPase subunit
VRDLTVEEPDIDEIIHHIYSAEPELGA